MRRGFGVAVVILAGAMTALTAEAAQAPGNLQARQTPGQSTGQTASSTSGATQSTQPPATSHGLHYVTVTFDYDFSKTPACSAKVKTKCVEKFVAYDISAGVKRRARLFDIPLPPRRVGPVQGISQKSPTKLDFESGKHLISVVAREPDGTESRHRACTTWIEIP
jgi:hypothetical protein